MIIRNCKLVKELTEETNLEQADILIEGDKIVRIVPCGEIPAQPKEDFDAAGATLLPGLIDMHVHLFMGKTNAWDSSNRINNYGQRVLDCLKYAQFLLDLGFTTVRDVGDEIHYPSIAVRNAINEGDFTGPRIKCTGVTISPHTAGFEAYDFMNNYINDANEMRATVRKQFANGADLIKLYGTGSMMVDDSLPGRRILMEDEVKAAVAVADLRGSYCACHCHGAEAIGVMIDSGVHTIEHASFITDDSCKKLDKRTDIGIVPTLSCSCHEMNLVDGYGEEQCAKFDVINAQRDVCIKNAYDNYEILMGWGTDLAMESHAKLPFKEWEERERLGFSNLDILKQATINGAVLMRMEDQVGTVKAGKYADLILVDGDPVADITVMHKKPMHVIKGGKIIR